MVVSYVFPSLPPKKEDSFFLLCRHHFTPSIYLSVGQIPKRKAFLSQKIKHFPYLLFHFIEKVAGEEMNKGNESRIFHFFGKCNRAHFFVFFGKVRG